MIKKPFTHIGLIIDCFQLIPIRETKNWWVSITGKKFRKKNGLNLNRPDYILDIKSIRVI